MTQAPKWLKQPVTHQFFSGQKVLFNGKDVVTFLSWHNGTPASGYAWVSAPTTACVRSWQLQPLEAQPLPKRETNV